MVFKKTKESIKCKYCGSEHTVCNGNKYNKQRFIWLVSIDFSKLKFDFRHQFFLE